MKFLLSSFVLTIGLAAFISLGANPLSADIIVFELGTDPLEEVAPAVPLGEALDSLDNPDDDNSASTATFNGITFVATATTSFGDGTAVYNSAGSGSGVNTGGGGGAIGDDASAIDVGEVLTFTLTFDESLLEVALEEIDFGGANEPDEISGLTDSAIFSISGGPATEFTGDADFTSAPISLSSGDTLVFSNASTEEAASFDINDISLHIKPLSSVPEPSSISLFGLGSLALLGHRKRNY